MYTLQAIVAATIASWLLDYTGVRRRDKIAATSCGDDRPVYAPLFDRLTHTLVAGTTADMFRRACGALC